MRFISIIAAPLAIALIVPVAAAKRKAPATSGWTAGQEKTAPAVSDPAYAAFDSGHYLKAEKLAKAAAAKGSKTASTLLGVLYEKGLGVPQNFKAAAEWYAKGAALGDVDAQFSIGVMLAEGRGIKKNKSQAAQFFEMAAKQRHPVALYNLAIIYTAGSEREKDLKKAAQLIEQSANLGYAPAQYDLAGFYKQGLNQSGNGVVPDNKKATYWLGKAAENGHTNAELEYGIALIRGSGVPKNAQRGVAFIRRAANKGNPVAQNRMAVAYRTGLGVERNLVEAAKWHLLSRQGGYSDFKLDVMVSELPEKDQKAAKKAAYDFQQRGDALLQ
ncbi:MAG: tetratricopeptide repeat protein [Alphaproteobacteria bacterium]